MATHGVMTKSSLTMAKEACAAALKALPKYSARRSHHDYTQARLRAARDIRVGYCPTDCGTFFKAQNVGARAVA